MKKTDRRKGCDERRIFECMISQLSQTPKHYLFFKKKQNHTSTTFDGGFQTLANCYIPNINSKQRSC